jgi:hypothetical protein
MATTPLHSESVQAKPFSTIDLECACFDAESLAELLNFLSSSELFCQQGQSALRGVAKLARDHYETLQELSERAHADKLAARGDNVAEFPG